MSGSGFMARGDAMGARIGEFGHEWLRRNLGTALGWGEFALISSLTCDYLVHLGVDHARDSDKSTRSMAATGAMLWLLLFCQTTQLGACGRCNDSISAIWKASCSHHGYHLIWTITLIQVTALIISAVRQSTYVLARDGSRRRRQRPASLSLRFAATVRGRASQSRRRATGTSDLSFE